MSNCDPGIMLLTAFNESQLEAIMAAISTNGGDTIAEVKGEQRRRFIRPVLSFIPVDEIDPIEIGHILRGIFVVVQDFLSAQWTTDQFALALSRGGGVNLDYATQIVRDRVVTPDSDMRGFAKKLMSYVWDIPGPIDDAIRGGIHMLDAALDRLVPTDWRNYSRDVLFELRNLGMAIGEMGLRTKLSIAEGAFEGMPAETSSGGSPTAGAGDLASATGALALVAKALTRLMSVKSETGDLGQSGLDESEIRGLLKEAGDLAMCLPRPGSFEAGGFLDDVGGFIAKAAPVIEAAAPIAGLTGAGQVLSPALHTVQSMLHSDSHVPAHQLVSSAVPAVAALPLPGPRPSHGMTVRIARNAGAARTPHELSIVIKGDEVQIR